MSDTPRTDELAQGWDEGLAMPSQMLTLARELERENIALRSDLNKCNNLSEIRRDAFYDEKSARWAMVDRMRELERENAALRNEIARMNNQTNWVCKCGGTDCEGQKENAALRAVLKRWLKVADDCHLEQQEVGYSEYNITVGLMVDTRALLDAARKEAQP